LAIFLLNCKANLERLLNTRPKTVEELVSLSEQILYLLKENVTSTTILEPPLLARLYKHYDLYYLKLMSQISESISQGKEDLQALNLVKTLINYELTFAQMMQTPDKPYENLSPFLEMLIYVYDTPILSDCLFTISQKIGPELSTEDEDWSSRLVFFTSRILKSLGSFELKAQLKEEEIKLLQTKIKTDLIHLLTQDKIELTQLCPLLKSKEVLTAEECLLIKKTLVQHKENLSLGKVYELAALLALHRGIEDLLAEQSGTLLSLMITTVNVFSIFLYCFI